MRLKLSILFILLVNSTWIQAANSIPWQSILLVVAIISAIGATIFSMKNENADSKSAKFLLGGLYFWIITFAQMIILAAIYQFWY